MKDTLIQAFQNSGFTITVEQADQFLQYYEMLVEKNKVMNLTAITEFHDVIQKHFIDSIMLGKVLSEQQLNNTKRFLDLGTGAGFPGIPLKIMYPEISITLMDSLNKRIIFLNEVISTLGLNKIEAVHGRAEEMARKQEYREQFDYCVSRAVSNLSTLSEYCLPFVKVDGMFISYKSGDIDSEISTAEHAITLLSSKLVSIKKFNLPGSDISRSFVMIQKEKPISKKYPRKAGLPAKEPLK